MATSQTNVGDMSVIGRVTATSGFSGPNVRTDRVTETDLEFELPIQAFRVWDAYQTLLGTGAADDMGIITGTFGSGTPYLSSGELNASGALTRYARLMFQIPYHFVGAQDFRLRLVAGMVTSVASVSATIDAEIRVSNGIGGINGSDIVTTSATSVNTVGATTNDFLCTGSGLERGQMLDLRITSATNSATASSHFLGIFRVAMVWPSKT